MKSLAKIILFMSGIAVLLAITGVYGVMTFAISQRMREFGIQMMLGATRQSLFRCGNDARSSPDRPWYSLRTGTGHARRVGFHAPHQKRMDAGRYFRSPLCTASRAHPARGLSLRDVPPGVPGKPGRSYTGAAERIGEAFSSKYRNRLNIYR